MDVDRILVPIDYSEQSRRALEHAIALGAKLGAKVDVPTLDGRVKLKIPSGTQSERVFRLRGKGVRPVRGGSPGDVLCRVRVETPVNLTPRQKELLAELQESFAGGSTKHSPRQKSWLDGVRKFFEDMHL